MFSATDVASFLACQHTATLDRAESRKEISKPFFNDPTIELLQHLGLEHEKRYLHELVRTEGRSITEIDQTVSWQEAVSRTVDALRLGVQAIYQATFLEGPWRGRADFLIRVDRPSSLGSWSYEVVDTKLARSTKSGAVIQLCFYSDLLAKVQGLEPERMHVVLGGGVKPEEFSVQRYIAYYRRVRREYETAWKSERSTSATCRERAFQRRLGCSSAATKRTACIVGTTSSIWRFSRLRLPRSRSISGTSLKVRTAMKQP